MDPATLLPLLSMLSPNYQHYALTVLVTLGALTVLAAPLKALVPMLRNWAHKTASTADDAAVENFAAAVDWFASLLGWAQSMLEYLALHKLPGQKTGRAVSK